MAADRIRVGEADIMIAGGVESMSMVPMSGNTPSLSPDIFKDENKNHSNHYFTASVEGSSCIGSIIQR